MCTIAESNVLLRTLAELPAGFKVAADELPEGWNRMRVGGTARLGKKAQTHGWNFLKTADGEVRSGVGKTSELAIASALKLALRRVDAESNAVEVRRIEVTHYPWFVLARLSLHPYRLQQDAELARPAAVAAAPVARRSTKLSHQAVIGFPEFGSAMSVLKQLIALKSNRVEAAQ